MQFIIRIFTLFIDKEIQQQLIKIFGDNYLKYNVFKNNVIDLNSFIKMATDPQEWLKLIKNLPNIERIELEKKITFYEKKVKEYSYKNITTTHNVFDKDSYNQDKQEFNNHLENGNSTQLSSSWIKSGRWNPTHKNKAIGNLTIWLKTKYGPYTYPAFPYEYWIEMTKAKGMNGTGAGSVLWKVWLRQWLISDLRKDIINKIRDKPYLNDLNITIDKINQASNSYYRNNKANNLSNLNKEWYKGRNNQKGKLTAKIKENNTYTYTITQPIRLIKRSVKIETKITEKYKKVKIKNPYKIKINKPIKTIKKYS